MKPFSKVFFVGMPQQSSAVDPVFVFFWPTLGGARLGEPRPHLDLSAHKVVGHVEIQPPGGPRPGQPRIFGLAVKGVVLDRVVLDGPGPNVSGI